MVYLHILLDFYVWFCYNIIMNRSLIDKLKKWKDKPGRKPLVLYGVRQAGKTWIMKDFGDKCYKQTAYFSFDNNEKLREIFKNDLNVTRIIHALSAEIGFNITASDTLIIFDEIQECPIAMTSLKYFNENAPEYNIIAAGSLLGVMSLEGTGFPVGKVDMLTLYPMTFFEFLQAVDNRFMETINNLDFDLLPVFHDSLIELLKQYFFIGGMPASVKCYAETKNFFDVREVQTTIINAYYADFIKHIPDSNIAKVRTLWDSVPAQLSKENKRFLYSDIKQGSRGRDYELALQWLKDTGLIKMLNRVSLPKMPLIAYQEASIFKLYMSDIGLLSARTSLDPKIYNDTNNLFTHYKGVLAEQFVLQELLALTGSMPIYYWAQDKNNAEIDFVIQHENMIIPIEVKAGTNIKSESLKTYKKLFNPQVSVISSQNKYKKGGETIEIPLYLIGKIKELI